MCLVVALIACACSADPCPYPAAHHRANSGSDHGEWLSGQDTYGLKLG